MTTSDNNKMIAIFMGAKTYTTNPNIVHKQQDIWVPYYGICRWDTVDLGRGKILEYHKSWDWLIPVIDKITSDDSYPKYVDHTRNIVDKGGVFINTKFIEVTYNNVVDFLNWYNGK